MLPVEKTFRQKTIEIFICYIPGRLLLKLKVTFSNIVLSQVFIYSFYLGIVTWIRLVGKRHQSPVISHKKQYSIQLLFCLTTSKIVNNTTFLPVNHNKPSLTFLLLNCLFLFFIHSKLELLYFQLQMTKNIYVYEKLDISNIELLD